MSVHLFAILLTVGFAGAQNGPALECLPRDRIECGCTVRLTGLACSADDSSRHHLYSGLTDGAPLWIRLDGRETELRSSRAASQSFSFAQGDSWTETYTRGNLSVAVSYRPGRNTCQKPPPETCEYFDVQATVILTRGKHPPSRYEGIGACGC